MEQLVEARGIRRQVLFYEVLDLLLQAPEPEVLASLNYELDVDQTGNQGTNKAIAYLRGI